MPFILYYYMQLAGGKKIEINLEAYPILFAGTLVLTIFVALMSFNDIKKFH